MFSPTGQAFTGSISVTITDTTPNAAIFYTTDGTTPTAASTAYTGPITVTNTDTGQSVRLTTNDAGDYLASSLLIGTYSISAEKPGFQKVTQTLARVDVNKVIRVDLSLPVGVVTVTS